MLSHISLLSDPALDGLLRLDWEGGPEGGVPEWLLDLDVLSSEGLVIPCLASAIIRRALSRNCWRRSSSS